MKAMNLTRTNSIDQIRTYCSDMFSFSRSNSVLKAQELYILAQERVPHKENIIIDRRLRT